MDFRTFARTAHALGFVHNHLDRDANRRDDAAFVDGQRRDPSSRTLVLLDDDALVRSAGLTTTPWFGFDVAAGLGPIGETVFLGRDDAGSCFATRIEAGADEVRLPDHVAGSNLRALATDGSVSPSDLGALAEGKALLHWHRSHRFCSNCGTPSTLSGAGWRRECPSCGTHHFPRTDPVVIMLAVDGERCLLGRQPRFPPRMYSCLAGFLEPGETIEAAVGRELNEEAGITVDEVSYLGSQPWPFPASLMIGCLARTVSNRIVVDHHELEDARWFDRTEVAAMLAGRHPDGLVCPVPMAIAHHLVRAWADDPLLPPTAEGPI